MWFMLLRMFESDSQNVKYGFPVFFENMIKNEKRTIILIVDNAYF